MYELEFIIGISILALILAVILARNVLSNDVGTATKCLILGLRVVGQ